MTKVDIFSGFLGAGKTTLIKKLISEAYKGEKVVLIENEFGSIGIDGEFMKDSGIQVNELNSGCICCSLVGDFSKSLKEVISQYNPDRIIIEPSGVGKLSDVMQAVENVDSKEIVVNGLSTIVDANKCKMYMKNFGEFFNNQIEYANCIILSHTDKMNDEKLAQVIEMIKDKNDHATIVTTSWDLISGKDILDCIEHIDTLKTEIEELEHEHHHEHGEECHCHEHEHHHDHDEECHCHEHEHHHDHDEECHCYEHEHHHDHDEECHCHEHEHHHDHDEECHCHDHDHEHHHHHHHADEVFTSWGLETVKKFTTDEIKDKLLALQNEEKYGMILRSKGIVASDTEQWIHFDYIPGEPDVRFGSASVCGRICVIGSKINEDAIKELFN